MTCVSMPERFLGLTYPSYHCQPKYEGGLSQLIANFVCLKAQSSNTVPTAPQAQAFIKGSDLVQRYLEKHLPWWTNEVTGPGRPLRATA